MASSRQLRLGAFMRPISIHTAAWRYPGAFPDANFNFQHLKQFAQKLEHGKFDAFFMADHLAVLNMPMEALKRSATVTSFDPLILLPALAVVTEHLGLIATASTTHNEPYHVARKFASLDHLSGGRAAWNVVTSTHNAAALNFGRERLNEHDLRYEIATEFVRLDVNVIVTVGSSPTLAVKHATSLIPIVFFSGDPVRSGLVASLARPGGNATGLALNPIGLAGKRLDLSPGDVRRLMRRLATATLALSGALIARDRHPVHPRPRRP